MPRALHIEDACHLLGGLCHLDESLDLRTRTTDGGVRRCCVHARFDVGELIGERGDLVRGVFDERHGALRGRTESLLALGQQA